MCSIVTITEELQTSRPFAVHCLAQCGFSFQLRPPVAKATTQSLARCASLLASATLEGMRTHELFWLHYEAA